ncbi:MAG: hypothetical protein J6H31_09935 [Butyrivibrio sp.]|nr:hypothetical protein [Butyrivibrio sp.]
MAAKVYGYAETDADVEVLRAYAAMDIILEDLTERGQYQILRRFLREGHWSALGDSALAIGAEIDYLQAEHIRLRILDLPITLQDLDGVSAAVVFQTLKEILLVLQQRHDDLQTLHRMRLQEGIQGAKNAGRRLGRTAIGYPKGWKRIFGRYQAKEIRALEASNALNISRATFYRLAKRYRQS